jgi:predicted nucleic acid-binding protein
VPIFVDTNVLVYARDASHQPKQARASEWVAHLWETEQGRLSLQVLHEYYVTTTRKLRPGLSRAEARADIEDLLAWRPIELDAWMLGPAWSLEDRFGLSYWDSLIVAAASVAGCDVILTEDLQHGADLDGVRVVDPFQVAVGEI